MLSIFAPGLHIAWIGKVSQLSALALNSSNVPIPLKTQNSKGYQTSKSYTLPSIKQDILQTDFQKISRYTKSLPQKQQMLQAECERIQNMAITFYMPTLKAALIKVLQQELLSLESQASEGALTLRDILYRMTNEAPMVGVIHHDHAIVHPMPAQQQRSSGTLTAPPESIPVVTAPTSSKASINNLLN